MKCPSSDASDSCHAPCIKKCKELLKNMPLSSVFTDRPCHDHALFLFVSQKYLHFLNSHQSQTDRARRGKGDRTEGVIKSNNQTGQRQTTPSQPGELRQLCDYYATSVCVPTCLRSLGRVRLPGMRTWYGHRPLSHAPFQWFSLKDWENQEIVFML